MSGRHLLKYSRKDFLSLASGSVALLLASPIRESSASSLHVTEQAEEKPLALDLREFVHWIVREF